MRDEGCKNVVHRIETPRRLIDIPIAMSCVFNKALQAAYEFVCMPDVFISQPQVLLLHNPVKHRGPFRTVAAR